MNPRIRRRLEKKALTLGSTQPEIDAMTDSELSSWVNDHDSTPTPTPTPTDPTPTDPTPTDPTPTDPFDMLRTALEQITGKVDESRVIELIKQYSQTPTTVNVTVTSPDKPTITIEGAHSALPDLLDLISLGLHPYLVGPAGSGKSTLARQAAESLDLDYYEESKILDEFSQVFGFKLPSGDLHVPDFVKAIEFGGLILLDELDASSPSALVAINGVLESGFIHHPDGRDLQLDPTKTVVVAAGNTLGNGPDLQYNGRQILDGATLNRFTIQKIAYDPAVEKSLAQTHYFESGGNDPQIINKWYKNVLAYREMAKSSGINVLITPRETIKGAKLLGKGWSVKKVHQTIIGNILTDDQRAQLGVDLV